MAQKRRISDLRRCQDCQLVTRYMNSNGCQAAMPGNFQIWRQFQQRVDHEFALVQAIMRHRQACGRDTLVAVQQYIQVQSAWAPTFIFTLPALFQLNAM